MNKKFQVNFFSIQSCSINFVLKFETLLMSLIVTVKNSNSLSPHENFLTHHRQLKKVFYDLRKFISSDKTVLRRSTKNKIKFIAFIIKRRSLFTSRLAPVKCFRVKITLFQNFVVVAGMKHLCE